MTELKQMSGDEFVTKILAGERDFRRIRLQQGYNFNSHEGFNELRDYIAKFGEQSAAFYFYNPPNASSQGYFKDIRLLLFMSPKGVFYHNSSVFFFR